jgi:hypothetical protein
MIYHGMRLLIPVITSIFAFLTSCGSVNLGKLRPEYEGVDPRVQPLVDEYKALAKMNGIRFYNKVSIGFKKINRGNTVGVCNYGSFFREIDVDIDFWLNSTNMSRLALVFHELSHCYCTRKHDYGKDKNYPETALERLERALIWKVQGGEKPGYWDDGCPKSLMYPVIPDDECLMKHYQEYVLEMFDRCKPW